MIKKYDYLFLLATLVSFLLANYLLLTGKTDEAFFVSLWVPTNLVLGIYFRNIATTKPQNSGK
ncbi:MAG: hypothetical protein SFU91_01720 [Chloroherpetonaceae bacterium]|nr:hypothetical protein [Chloroherpetonaceae bacterium]